MTTFSFTARIKSFKYALRGVAIVIAYEHNAWVHAMATLAVCALGLWAHLSRVEWSCIVLAIMTVWTAEALNTAIETVTDLASPEFHSLAERAKDVAAGAVLVAAIGAMLVGAFIFGPRLLGLLPW
jgi:diacylglycerol kinase (ATP)